MCQVYNPERALDVFDIMIKRLEESQSDQLSKASVLALVRGTYELAFEEVPAEEIYQGAAATLRRLQQQFQPRTRPRTESEDASYPIDIEAHVAMIQQICELTGKDTDSAPEVFRILYTLINKSYDAGRNGGKIDFIGALIENTACGIPVPKGIRETLAAFAAEAVDAYIYGVQESAAQQLLTADAK